MAPFRRPWRILFLVAATFTLLLLYKQRAISVTQLNPLAESNSVPFDNSTTIVVSALSKDDLQWIESLSSNVWKYEVDNSYSRHKIPKNKGNEAMVYLTHIIDEYDRLTDRMIFIHAGRYQWHNDDPRYDGKTTLQNLQLSYLDQEGYISLRCHWFQGCPAELKPTETHNDPADIKKSTDILEQIYAANFPRLFPDKSLPSTVAAGCCSQFGVTASTVRQNTREHYVRIRDWLLESEEPDYVTGRILEYSWHILFGKPAVHCPSAEECYCKVFGKCRLVCEEGDCGLYQYPIGAGWMTSLVWKLRHALG